MNPPPVGTAEREAPPSVEFPGFLPDDALRTLLQSATVYVQPSLHEAFGCAVAEAMLSGCIPVVSDRGSLPEVVGESGRYVRPDDPRELAVAIQSVVEQSPEFVEPPAARIARLFPLGHRRAQLYRLFEELCPT